MVNLENIKGVIWHHSGGTNADPLASTIHHTAEIIDQAHKGRWNGFVSSFYKNKYGAYFHVGYNYVIETLNKRIVKTRKVGEETAAAVGYNTGYIHVVVTGNYDVGADVWDASINDKVREVWTEIKGMCPHLKIKDNFPHRKVARKTCFGNSLGDNHIQSILVQVALDEGKSDREIELELKVSALESANKQLWSLVMTLYELLTGKRFTSRQK